MAKSKAKPTSNIAKMVLLGVLGTFLVAGLYLNSTMQKTSINQIVETNYTKPTSIPAPRECETVTSFSLSGSCGPTQYQSVSYTCGKVGTTRKLGVLNNADKNMQEGGDKCKSYIALFADAQADCANNCPKMTPTPTPTPTCIPVPTCRKGQRCPNYSANPRYCGYKPMR